MKTNKHQWAIFRLAVLSFFGFSVAALAGQDSVTMRGGEMEGVCSNSCSSIMVSNACSATMIGPNVFITAAHCVEAIGEASKDCGSAELKVLVFGNPACCQTGCSAGQCPPESDFALCQLASGSIKNFILMKPFEDLGWDDSWRQKAIPATLIGRGTPDLPNADIGKTTLVLDPEAPANGLVSFLGQASACPGDSGGGVFLENGAGGRTLVGVIQDGECKVGGETKVVDIMFWKNSQFVVAWMDGHKSAQICGTDESLSSMCRK